MSKNEICETPFTRRNSAETDGDLNGNLNDKLNDNLNSESAMEALIAPKDEKEQVVLKSNFVSFSDVENAEKEKKEAATSEEIKTIGLSLNNTQKIASSNIANLIMNITTKVILMNSVLFAGSFDEISYFVLFFTGVAILLSTIGGICTVAGFLVSEKKALNRLNNLIFMAAISSSAIEVVLLNFVKDGTNIATNVSATRNAAILPPTPS